MKRALTFLSLICALQLSAQVPFSVVDSIDVNNINAVALVHGDMWWKPFSSSYFGCFYPNGTSKLISFAGAMWLSGYDDGGNLHVSAQTYRQDGNDYWPGPLDAAGGLTYAISSDWAKIWKVNRSEVTDHKNRTYRNISNTPTSILEWPGKGNAYARGKDGVPLTVDREMAPFIDKNGDGIYQPLKGDYPDFKGDQALCWVLSDNGPSHSQTNGQPLKVEVLVMAYAYKRNTLIDNVVYYDYAITNRSADNYHGVRWAWWDCANLGYQSGDYAYFDSSRRLSVEYNYAVRDGGAAGSPFGFPSHYPVKGQTLIKTPGDGTGTYVPAGSFVYYNNDPSIIGVPTAPGEYQNYMHAKMRNGTHFTHEGRDVNYVFTDEPNVPGGWSECGVGNNPGRRTYILSTGDFSLSAGATHHVLMAMVVDSGVGGCPFVDLTRIKATSDTAWAVYHNPPPEVDVHDVAETTAGLTIFPNPAHDHITLKVKGMQDGSLSVFDLLGVKVASTTIKNGEARLAVDALSAGMYVARITSNDIVAPAYFVKK
ncbi:MAG: T9SS type A sorting domain-containing protein [Taibaiella sp.]|nr:T9SS type A sorting domain-containing protein [Taibaiella sp.]